MSNESTVSANTSMRLEETQEQSNKVQEEVRGGLVMITDWPLLGKAPKKTLLLNSHKDEAPTMVPNHVDVSPVDMANWQKFSILMSEPKYTDETWLVELRDSIMTLGDDVKQKAKDTMGSLSWARLVFLNVQHHENRFLVGTRVMDIDISTWDLFPMRLTNASLISCSAIIVATVECLLTMKACSFVEWNRKRKRSHTPIQQDSPLPPKSPLINDVPGQTSTSPGITQQSNPALDEPLSSVLRTQVSDLDPAMNTAADNPAKDDFLQAEQAALQYYELEQCKEETGVLRELVDKAISNQLDHIAHLHNVLLQHKIQLTSLQDLQLRYLQRLNTILHKPASAFNIVRYCSTSLILGLKAGASFQHLFNSTLKALQSSILEPFDGFTPAIISNIYVPTLEANNRLASLGRISSAVSASCHPISSTPSIKLLNLFTNSTNGPSLPCNSG
ncbi:uncharacterized protein EV420DRAFT_1472694 [Desarmillaria tabescens]|uniref:Uncharacterized protein n=1 Tax=Armillaria tabescens TaxID=1929756 RepID=A0AA39TT89_ARMTA|nr:uncharacterized protein EV420DRAFT_1472694 [Desarmillaria tabescens]KAK0469467.1 hypothetical protein EV420DRAFT_1472694 [Desarmillaria tabescens]